MNDVVKGEAGPFSEFHANFFKLFAALRPSETVICRIGSVALEFAAEAFFHLNLPKNQRTKTL